MSRDLRRHLRHQPPGTVRLTWHDASGCLKYARGRCLDISASGIRIEIPEPIPLRSYVTVSADKIGFTANASVRHVARVAGKYMIGMEFSCPLRAFADILARAQRHEPVHR